MEKHYWTAHVEFKMKYYGLSKQKVLGVMRRPERTEKGIAGNSTIAVMQPVSPKEIENKKVWKQEIWVMYQIKKQRKRKHQTHHREVSLEKMQTLLSGSTQLTIISAWRYPGVSPKNNPIPSDILREIMEYV